MNTCKLILPPELERIIQEYRINFDRVVATHEELARTRPGMDPALRIGLSTAITFLSKKA
jgi:hypothetical protein